jgi:hypothetical protein
MPTVGPILLLSETVDSRFNTREKHMLKDSVQPYNKPIIDLACSVCTLKYQTFVFLHGPRSFVARYMHILTQVMMGKKINYNIFSYTLLKRLRLHYSVAVQKAPVQYRMYNFQKLEETTSLRCKDFSENI